jgi:hypothetical protein
MQLTSLLKNVWRYNLLLLRLYVLHRNSYTSVVASKEIELELNADKTKYMVMSRDQNTGQSHNIVTDNSSFERVEQFKYLGTTLTNQNSIQE